jgi:hypothetical protein
MKGALGLLFTIFVLLANHYNVIAQTFIKSSTNAVGNDPTCIITVDVNGDGKRDLVSANYNTGLATSTLTVLTNNGNGTFNFSSAPSTGKASICVVATDVNGA